MLAAKDFHIDVSRKRIFWIWVRIRTTCEWQQYAYKRTWKPCQGECTGNITLPYEESWCQCFRNHVLEHTNQCFESTRNSTSSHGAHSKDQWFHVLFACCLSSSSLEEALAPAMNLISTPGVQVWISYWMISLFLIYTRRAKSLTVCCLQLRMSSSTLVHMFCHHIAWSCWNLSMAQWRTEMNCLQSCKLFAPSPSSCDVEHCD